MRIGNKGQIPSAEWPSIQQERCCFTCCMRVVSAISKCLSSLSGIVVDSRQTTRITHDPQRSISSIHPPGEITDMPLHPIEEEDQDPPSFLVHENMNEQENLGHTYFHIVSTPSHAASQSTDDSGSQKISETETSVVAPMQYPPGFGIEKIEGERNQT
ncbi:MAG TPA: hypothetical protein VGJ00_02120 [Rhabdochlamydiaceae bacterium]|jgi:hypothetical protein